nr:tryptophan synthase subunit alpha [Sphingomicrobium sp. B8]
MFARTRRAFGAFLMIGDPDLETSAKMLDAAVEGGADFLEVGIPFSDPVADGPVIQAASVRALAEGVRTDDCLKLLADFRKKHADIPVGILTYANIVIARGTGQFAGELKSAGVDSLLIADIPSVEIAPYASSIAAAGIDPVLIAAPNTSDEALAILAKHGRGYTYCVARKGVTGAKSDMELEHEGLFRRLEALGAPPPVLGFGISTRPQVEAAFDSGAAGAISGSAIVDAAAKADDPVAAVREKVSELSGQSLDRGNGGGEVACLYVAR